MASQSTIDRINDAIIALGQQKDLMLRGNADRPNYGDVYGAGARCVVIARALDAICLEYDATDFCFADAVSDAGFSGAADRADERLRAPRGPRCLIDEDYDR